jgi:polysaccharide pyruvyl transferase WcaK-like protein
MPEFAEKNRNKIAIFGHYGNKNYGDESIITAILENLKITIPEANLSCFSLNPEDSIRNHTVDSFPVRNIIPISSNQNNDISEINNYSSTDSQNTTPDQSVIKKVLKKIPLMKKSVLLLYQAIHGLKILPREIKFLKQSYHTIKDFNLLIVAGSNQFLDNFGGSWGFPFTLLKWSFLCKRAGVKLAYASVGAGPLDKWLSKFFVHLAIIRSDYLSYRDINSKQLVEKTIFSINGQIYPDLAHSLNFKSRNVATEPKVIGINPMPVFDNRYWYVHDNDKYLSYIERIAEFIEKLTELHHPVFFFNTMVKDLNVAHDIQNRLPEEIKSRISIKEAHSVKELMHIIDTADIIISTRFHGAVLSFLAEKPLLGICYYRKTRDIMHEMGQEKYAVDLEKFTVDQLLDLFDKLKQNYYTEKLKIIKKNLEYRNQLKEQYLSLKNLIM